MEEKAKKSQHMAQLMLHKERAESSH